MGKHKHRHRDRSRSSSIRKKSSKHKHGKKRKHSRSSSRDKPSTSKHGFGLSYEEMSTQKKKMKELAKLEETPEEKLQRRLEKKMNKDRKRRNLGGWDEEYLGYTNTDNPFGDDKLLQTFMWNKKLQNEGKGDLTRGEFEKEHKFKMAASKIELEKVKQRRLEREKEREDYENDKEMMQRSKESEYFKTWELQEDKFHLDQAKLRSKIRINDGRAKPIDLLAHYIRNEHENDSSLDLHEPYSYLNGLTAGDLEDLKEDIVVYMDMDRSAGNDHSFYWNDITTIANNEIRKFRAIDESGERRQAVNIAVKDDVGTIFAGKTIPQLQKLQSSIDKKLANSRNIDPGYWESLLQQLHAHIATLRLKKLHESILRAKLSRLKQEQGVMATGAAGEEDDNEDSIEQQYLRTKLRDQIDSKPDVEEYNTERYEPKYILESELPKGTLIIEFSEDLKRLQHSREQVENNGNIVASSDEQLVKKAMAGMDTDEVQFSVEMPIQHNVMLWSDKYRPRKPRFFNRVHTGFEWNKYNQTHYDVDNPPPKVVQGYKFNIFYPDLIDKSKAPEFTLTLLKNEPDFACLKFSAGPPYEAIAFKVVHREWECGYKRGFRCQFQNNVFQLWYHFKRYRYRR